MSANVHGDAQVSWLDGELRKQKAIVVELREQLDKRLVESADQQQRILSLEDRLAKLQAQLTRIPTVEEALQHTRDELVLKMAELRQEQQKRETEFLRNRQAERERDVIVMQGIESDLKRISSLEQAMATRQAEDQRLNEVQQRAQQELAAAVERILKLDGALRRVGDRVEYGLVKQGKVELSLQELQKSTQDDKLMLLEDAVAKLTQRIGGLDGMRAEITKREEELLEAQRRSDVERAQVLTEWGRRLEETSHQLQTWRDQLRYFTDQHDKSRRVLRDMQELAHQLSQQQDQLRQIQRISEEQVKRELRDWRSEDDRRWVTATDAQSKVLEQQALREQAQNERLQALEADRVADVKVVEALHISLGDLQLVLEAQVRALRESVLRYMEVQHEASNRITAEMTAALKAGGD